jgi:uncharacterized protein (TIGR02145 family)
LFDAEGNRYTVSRFGGVCWMTQNLRSTWTKQGNQVQTILEDKNIASSPNAVVYYYPSAYTAEDLPPDGYGFLYSWGAANVGTLSSEITDAFRDTTSNRQGICPDGWTLPSDYDWNQLEKEIATYPGLYSTENTTMDPAWESKYEVLVDWRPNSGTNTTWWGCRMKSPTKVNNTTSNGMSKTDAGFNVLLVGYFDSGKGASFGTNTYIWSSSAGSATAAWRRPLYSGNSGAYRLTTNKYYLFSVRCKK